jgi:branched-chain amino acid transport system permease protein
MTRFGVPFLAALPLAFVASAIVGDPRAVRLSPSARPPGPGALFPFMSIATATYFFGSSAAGAVAGLPTRAGRFLGAGFGVYRLFLIGAVSAHDLWAR